MTTQTAERTPVLTHVAHRGERALIQQTPFGWGFRWGLAEVKGIYSVFDLQPIFEAMVNRAQEDRKITVSRLEIERNSPEELKTLLEARLKLPMYAESKVEIS